MEPVKTVRSTSGASVASPVTIRENGCSSPPLWLISICQVPLGAIVPGANRILSTLLRSSLAPLGTEKPFANRW